MASYSLSDRLSRRVGKRTKKGTLITEELVDAVRGDEAVIVIIRENNARQIRRLFKQQIAAALEEVGLAAERFAKAACPVDTGRLRNSITHAIDAGREEVFVGTNVEYAPYVELGTHGREGVKFLTRAAQDHGNFYRRIFEKHLGQ